MKAKYKLIPLITLMLVLPGCGGWIWLDGSSVDYQSLESARLQCRIEERRDNLEDADDQLDEQLSQAKTNEAKMEARENYKRLKRQTDAEIRSCMRKLGLQPAG